MREAVIVSSVRTAVGKAGNTVGGRPGRRENFVHAAHEPNRRIRWRARNLGDLRSAGHDIDRNDIGKCSAGVYADAKACRSRTIGHASHHSPQG